MAEWLITVDGERFRVRTSPDGGLDFGWLSGKNRGYGFSSSWPHERPPTTGELEESAHQFLIQVDPVTGSIEDGETDS